MALVRTVRWLGTLAIATGCAVVAVACGSGAPTSDFTPGQQGGPDGAPSDATTEGGTFGTEGGTGCKPTTCADKGYTCGQNGDGCGGVLDCGTCMFPQFCGGGGYSKCGGNINDGPDGAPLCTPTTCAALGAGCGPAGDGCGGVLACGTCTDPQYCGGGGFAKCGGNNGLNPDGGVPCTPTTCAALGYTCGPSADGCGGLLDCGSCTNPQFCGGGGFNLCGGNNGLSPDGGVPCTPTTCAALGYSCGVAADGCGGALNCGACTNPQFCGGGGYDVCGGNNGLSPDGGVPCTPTTCSALGYNCGVAADGCGGALDCGTCTDPQFCGGGGYDTCGGSNGLAPDGSIPCTATTCAALGFNCGIAGDGCGGQLDCGTCAGGAYCGGGGFNRCGTTGLGADGSVPCTATTCAALGFTCGTAGDGCGGTLNCGSCTNPQYCGGGGFSQCGGNNGLTPDGGVACTPTTCAALGYDCGTASDGCGGLLTCGTCTDPQYCGGGGFDVCGGNNGLNPDGGVKCTPTTCATQGINCGQAGDGCGGPLSCGSCADPQFCGGGGFGKCGGNNGLNPDGSVPCTPTTCAALGYNCGSAADGCGGVLHCGACTNPQYCGGGGFDVCGGNNGLNPDGGVICNGTTCAALGFNCGVAGDGCGGQLNCGTCTGGAYCGGGGFNQCGTTGLNPDGSVPCTPVTCAQLGYTCGIAADGCGGQLNCGACTDPQYCGGSGYDKCGGNNGLNPDGGVKCTPITCAAQNLNCGQAGDGCGGTLNCGSCTDPQFCGGGGFGKCGGNNGLNPDGGVACTPTSCAAQGINCGQAGDGCGGTLSCGSCTDPQFCGGGGFGKCGGNNGLNPDGSVACTPTTCAALGYNCGVADDGCGGQLSCGGCTDPQYCGGGGFNKCGGSNGLNPDGSVACTPTTCVALGYNCGVADDGCGGTLSCGTCAVASQCGLGGYNRCPGGVKTCDSGSTTISGYVYDPGGHLPVYNATVYVPYGKVQQPESGVNSGTCGCVAPPALASTTTGIDGSFTLSVPNDTTLIVIQLGKWQITYTETLNVCSNTALGTTACNAPGGKCLTMPSKHPSTAGWPPNGNNGEGNIPRFAVDTGAVDSMECVLSKMGISTAEFVNPAIASGVPTATGRIHLYQGSIVSGGAVINASTPKEAALTETSTVMDAYDVVLFPCQGGAGTYTAANGWTNTLTNLVSYTTLGGRAFATHYHYDLLYGNGAGTALGAAGYGPFVSTATWAPGSGSWGNYYADPAYNALIDSATAPLATWLNQTVVYGGTLGQIPVGVVRNDFTAVNAPAERWIYTANDTNEYGTNTGPGANLPIHYSFDTPYTKGGADGTCGRVVYSDFHVESEPSATGYKNVVFPAECQGGATGTLTPQEKLLEYMIFNLTSCVGTPTCTPQTCASLGYACGPQGDGCGGTLQCGTCTSPQTCGGGGVYGQCGYPDAGACTPKTCAQLGYNCGPQGDGCGGTLQCGTCTSPQTCGGGGVYGHCGYPDAGSCTPMTCAQQNINCGAAGDGCGNPLSCGSCVAPQTCGGGGVPGECGYPDAGSCAPLTCAQQGINCGPAGDGCGNALACGTCVAPQTCGGGGVPGDCGYPDAAACVPLTCAQQSINCGPAGDGCGSALSCGTCVAPQTCGGGGVFGQCGFPDAAVCQPETCAQQNIKCGPAGDGCGNALSCGTCPNGQTCGGGGTPGQCGYPDAGSCTPLTCAEQSIDCGPAGDGCGAQIQCGTCASPQTCGGGGVFGQCGYPDGGNCTPLTCAQQGISCGPAGDGCGGALQCGTCSSPQTCGGGGVPGVCGYPDSGSCSPLTCAQQNLTCGPAGDGCGNQLDCGSCPSPQTCGGGGVFGQCGYPDASACVPQTCAQQSITCGPAGDGCGGALQCGSCVAPQTCGGGGVPGQCGFPEAGVCHPETCTDQHITCGPAGDGCGGSLQCGTCSGGTTCGGGGVPGQCGAPDAGVCTPLTCAQQNITCGSAGDGCGGTLQCGSCSAPDTCGGGGVPGQCGYPDGGTCTPITCAQQSISCGPAGDGCGGLLQCGTCTAPQTCGGGGMPGMCGYPDGGVCQPKTCAQQNISCGPAGDGCGNQIDCGPCTAPQTCGGGGVPGVCGYPDAGTCQPETCAQQNLSCGPSGDGCGNLIQCGMCTPPEVCGGGGVHGQCGMPDGGDCVPLTCKQQNLACGQAGDGCGNLIMCGTCTGSQTCGGGGVAGQCGGGAQ
jgi:hypothetical protein